VKESRFIELLNLYIDQQITSEDAAALEEEIMANPRRRRTYQQYCRMQRACTLVFENSRGERAAPSDGRVEPASIPFEPAARRPSWRFYAAGLAAAACVGFVAVQVYLHPGRTPLRGDFAAVQRPAVQPVRIKPAEPWRLDVAAAPVILTRNTPLTTVNFATLSTQARTATDSFRPSVEAFVFEQTAPGPGSVTTFRSRPPGEGETEMTAFQFQR
jgi:hypothetical protein